MRIGSGQLTGFTRTALLLASCLALVAMTTGLLLALHLLEAEHSGAHNAHKCGVCQQLLAVSKKLLLAATAEPICDSPAVRTDTPESAEHVEARSPHVSRPRGPPCSPSVHSV